MNVTLFEGGITNTKDPKIVSIEDVYNMIKSPEMYDKTVFLKKNYKTDIISYKSEKSKLPNVVFSGEFSERNGQACTKYNGNIILDIDKVGDQKKLIKIKEYFKKQSPTLLMFISPSGDGIKVVQRVFVPENLTQIESFHKRAFDHLKDKHNAVLNQLGVEVDDSGNDIARTCYLNFDEKVFINKQCGVYEVPDKERVSDVKVDETGEVTTYKPLNENPSKNIELIEDIIKWVNEKKIDLTTPYNKWIDIAMGIKNTFGGGGLEYFIAISSVNKGFKREDCIKKWDSIKNKSINKPITFATLVHFALSKGYEIPKKIKLDGGTFKNICIQKLIENNIQIKFETDVKRLMMKSGSGVWHTLTDEDAAIIRIRYFEGRITKADIFDYLITIAPQFSASTEFINSLPEWDGVDRIKDLANTVNVLDVEGTKTIWNTYIKKWLVGVIAGIHNVDGDLKNENILVLSGKQGVGKTMWVKKLLPVEWKKYLATKNLDFDNKDDRIMMAEKFIIFLDEGISFSKSDVKAIKEITSKGMFSDRAPYGRANVDYMRKNSFIAATNDLEILSDMTGNRRYWIVRAESINYEHNIDMYQVWAQALNLFRNGEKYYLNQEEIEMINTANAYFEIPDATTEFIRKTFEICSTDESKMTISEILNNIKRYEKEYNLISDVNVYRVGKILTRLGYQKKRLGCKNNQEYFYGIKFRSTDEKIKIKIEKTLFEPIYQ